MSEEKEKEAEYKFLEEAIMQTVLIIGAEPQGIQCLRALQAALPSNQSESLMIVDPHSQSIVEFRMQLQNCIAGVAL